MAYTFPMTLAQFFDTLPIRSVTCELTEALEMSETGAGELLTANLGVRLWEATVELAPKYYSEMAQITAKLDVLRHAGRSLLVNSFPLIAPQADPTGTVLGGANVLLTSVTSNNREIDLSGLPVGYKLTTGDFLSFTYGVNPVRHGMYQIAAGGTSLDGTLRVEVSTFVAPGWVVSAPVKLIKPTFKGVIVPKSTNVGKSSGRFTDGVSFKVRQTFR